MGQGQQKPTISTFPINRDPNIAPTVNNVNPNSSN